MFLKKGNLYVIIVIIFFILSICLADGLLTVSAGGYDRGINYNSHTITDGDIICAGGVSPGEFIVEGTSFSVHGNGDYYYEIKKNGSIIKYGFFDESGFDYSLTAVSGDVITLGIKWNSDIPMPTPPRWFDTTGTLNLLF